MFVYESKIRLYDTDAAGILFFANQFRLVEEAYEAFLENNGLSIGEFLKAGDFLVPIVHAETDFLAPLVPGDGIVIEIDLLNISENSFTLGHRIIKEDNTLCGKGSTVHVTVSRRNFKKIPLPEKIKFILGSI